MEMEMGMGTEGQQLAPTSSLLDSAAHSTLAQLNRHIQTIWEALPPNTAFIVCGGHGNFSRLKRYHQTDLSKQPQPIQHNQYNTINTTQHNQHNTINTTQPIQHISTQLFSFCSLRTQRQERQLDGSWSESDEIDMLAHIELERLSVAYIGVKPHPSQPIQTEPNQTKPN